MNYESKKAEIESKIKELQEQLETLEKTAKKEEWKKSLVEKFKEFLERTDFTKVEHVEFYAKRSGSNVPEACEVWFYNPEKVETQPEPEPKTEEINEPAEKPENKVVVCSVPKPNETPEEKPVKMKMTLDEFIDSLPEPAQK